MSANEFNWKSHKTGRVLARSVKSTRTLSAMCVHGSTGIVMELDAAHAGSLCVIRKAHSEMDMFQCLAFLGVCLVRLADRFIVSATAHGERGRTVLIDSDRREIAARSKQCCNVCRMFCNMYEIEMYRSQPSSRATYI